MALHQLKYPYRKFIQPVVKKLTFINPDFISAIAFFVAFIKSVSPIISILKNLEIRSFPIIYPILCTPINSVA